MSNIMSPILVVNLQATEDQAIEQVKACIQQKPAISKYRFSE